MPGFLPHKIYKHEKFIAPIVGFHDHIRRAEFNVWSFRFDLAASYVSDTGLDIRYRHGDPGILPASSTLLYSTEKKHSWIFFLLAFINLGAGIAALLYPHVTVPFLIILIGLTWLATGMLQIVAAFRLRKEIHNEGWLVIIGVVSILSGAFVLLRPGDGVLALLWLIAAYAIVFVIGLLILGFKAKKWISMDDVMMWAE